MKKQIAGIIIIVAAIIVITVVGVDNGKGQTNLQSFGNNKQIEMAYGFYTQIPQKYSDMVAYTQEHFEGRVTDSFVLKNGETEISLFCIDYGDRESGDWLGFLNIDDQNVPVTYTFFRADPEDVAKLDEDGKEAYAVMQENFSGILNAIITDPRFVEEEQVVAETDRQMDMEYWDVSLLDRVYCIESADNGDYQADFFGEVSGEQIKLYSVRIGDESLQTELGLFEIDSVKKMISVENYPLSDQNDWEQSDFELAYRMMDTINDIIQQIMSSEYFYPLDTE